MPRRSSQQHPAGGSTIGATNAPTFFGRIDSTVEALRLVRAAQLGLVPRIRRRLNMEEREKMVVSGAVFVFNVAEASMQRWTDGKLWSPSRIDGNFLVYRELSEKKEVVVVSDRFEEWTPGDDAGAIGSGSRARARGPRSPPPVAEPPPTSGGFKPGGLAKKTITVKISNIDHHLVAYFIQEDVDSGKLSTVYSRPDIMQASMPPSIFHFSEFRLPPRVVQTIGNEPQRIVCEPETIGSSAVEESAGPWHADMHYPGTASQTEPMSMNLEWPSEPRHEQSLRSANISTQYRTETEVPSSPSVSPEDHRNSRWVQPASNHPEHPLSNVYAEHWSPQSYPSNPTMPSRSYSYSSQSALHPISNDPQVDAETHGGGREESVWHERGGQEEQQFWGSQNRHDHSYDPDNLAPAFSASSTSTFPNMHPPGRQATSPTSPHSSHEFQQADEFYGSRNHER